MSSVTSRPTPARPSAADGGAVRVPGADDGGDAVVLELLRERGSASIADLIEALGVTATAVRHRVIRLLEKGWVERETVRAGRGRPGHAYRLTREGLLHCGHNLADLAAVLWRELLAIPDEAIRRAVMARVAKSLAADYADGTTDGAPAGTVAGRMATVADLFRHRRIPMEATRDGDDLPVIKAHACPYPGLAEHDRSVCEMEAMMLSELVGESLVLSECQATGGSCCTFGQSSTTAPASKDVTTGDGRSAPASGGSPS